MDGKILSNYIASQAVHELYGGVVPELASRAHMQNIVPVVDAALDAAGLSGMDACQKLSSVDAIAFTQAPGLIGSLLVGAQFAKSLSLALDKPLIAVHHMQAHVLANLIGDPKPDFPFLCLTVSGGHTQIVLASSPLKLEVLGHTIDDAAGDIGWGAKHQCGYRVMPGTGKADLIKTEDGNVCRHSWFECTYVIAIQYLGTS